VSDSTSTKFTASDGRRFAFSVGAAFLLLAGVLWWRDKGTPAEVLAAIGAILYAAGAIAPSRLGPIYRGWMAIALAISKVTTPIFMTVVYFGVITPSGWIMRLLGKQPLRHAADAGSFWRPPTGGGSSDLRRQF